MVHQPSYSQSPCCVHNESIFWGPEGQGSYLSCPLQQVIVVYSNVRFQSLGNSIFWESFTNALYSRCVLNWFGDWSTEALYQVGKEFTSKMDLEKPNYIVPDYMPVVYDKLPQPPSHREAIVNSCVFVHQTLHQVCFIILLNSCCSLFLSIMHQFSKTYGI